MGWRTRVVTSCALLGLGCSGIAMLGCASIVGADDYKVDPSATGTGTGGGQDAGPDSGGACLAAGVACTSQPTGGCSGICTHPVADPLARSFCAALCTVNTDCVSGCCAPLDNDTRRACAARGFCSDTCSFDGNACDTTDDCCADETCVDNNVTVVCRNNCITNADCPTNCCAALSNSTTKVCSPPSLCTSSK